MIQTENSPERCTGSDPMTRRFNIGSAWFAACMVLAFLIMPFFYAEKEITIGLTIAQIAVWLALASVWFYLGSLTEMSGTGFRFEYGQPRKLSHYGSVREILVFLFPFLSCAFGYVYVTYLNTGYIGFNIIIFFVVAGFSTYFFPLWLVGVFIVFETLGWNLLGYSLWGSWQRGDDLIQIFSGFAFSVMMFQLFQTERKSRHRAVALSRDLDTANEKLRERSSQVEELASTRERNRIAREIHDTLGHSLTVVNMQLETARALVMDDAGKAAVFIDKAQAVTKQGLSDIRSSVAALRSSPLDGKTLAQAMQELLDGSRTSGISASFKQEGTARLLPDHVELALYRSVQEGLTNVRKHAKAKSVNLLLNYTEVDCVTMALRDDGVGCEIATGGFGIMGIRERIQLLDGETKIKTSPDNGLELLISVKV